MRTWRSISLALILAGCSSNATTGGDGGNPGGDGGGAIDLAGVKPLQTVFIILLENHNWSDIKGSASAPYINNTLLAMGAHAEMYFNAPGIHPSEPNYLWLEAGTNFGVLDDNPPSANHQSSTSHLATQLKAANISWRSYQEDISGTDCPLIAVKNYAPKHDPFVFFDDSTGSNNPNDSYCIMHNRPMTELAGDLSGNSVARYNFLTPNLCDDMHDTCAPQNNQIKQGDDWLAQNVPMIMASAAYQNGGVILITWDESELGDFPIGMIAISSKAKTGYSNSIRYTHGSTLRSVQEIFGVTPLLGDAANQTDLADLFVSFP